MSKLIEYDEVARRAIEAGVNTLADAVRVTLGPRGRHVMLATSWGGPTVTNDGVTVAREIDLADPFENLGAQLVKSVATKTNDVAGDGTTTATVLAQALVTGGLRLVAAGANALEVGTGISKAAGQDVRTLPYLHWWSFLAWFDAIGEGSFATVVAIRDKLRRGKRLENWELDYYRTHRAVVELRGVESAEEQAEKRRLLALLGG